jgi:O-acetyl-ADP-ribose deacetylase (regulator of RNase III)
MFAEPKSRKGLMETLFGKTKLKTIKGDITVLSTEAIVNAANSGLMGGGGVDGAIHRAGGPAILEECKKIIGKIGRLPAGEAVVTTAGNMPSMRVIHTVGPVWHGGGHGEEQKLKNCYTNSLKAAVDHGLRTIAFPSVSTGIYGYPVDLAAAAAVKAVLSFIEKHPGAIDEIIFCGFDSGTEMEYASALTAALK